MRISYINGKRLRYAISYGAMEVIRNTDYLNTINVFPVPDGDTGSNLSSTMHTIMRETVFDDRIDKSFQSLAESAITGARGNSGIIFAQFLSGMAMEIRNMEILSTRVFAESVMKAAAYTYQSMTNPVEGTMLTVIREWARAIYDFRSQTQDFAILLNRAQGVAQKSLAETQSLLDVLREAKVVDSGAKGFVHFTEGIVKLINSGDLRQPLLFVPGNKPVYMQNDVHDMQNGFPEERYCTEILIERSGNFDEDGLRRLLKSNGSSAVVAIGSERTRIHIHTNSPSFISSKMAEYGRMIEVKVDDMHSQYNLAHSRKTDIAIVTDSVADLPQGFAFSNNVTVVPINIEIDGSLYLDKVTLMPGQFGVLTERARTFPKSFQPTPKSFHGVFSFLLSHYSHVIGLFVSSALSGTFNSAVKASEQFPKGDRSRIAIVDTKLNSAAQGLIVAEACEAVAKGNAFERVLETIRKDIETAKIYVSVDTFDYMVKGGRVGPMKGFIANAMNMKPIVSLDENGSGIAFAKSFSRSGNMKTIMSMVENFEAQRGIRKYALVHCGGEDIAHGYSKKLERLLARPPEYVAEVSSVVAMSAGKKAVAVAFLCGKSKGVEWSEPDCC